MEELPKPMTGMPESVVKSIARHANRWGSYSAMKHVIQTELDRRGIPVPLDPQPASFLLEYPQWMQKNLMVVFQCEN